MNKSMKLMSLGFVALCMTLTVQANENDKAHQNMKGDVAEASTQVAISTSGIVKEIDFENKKITIAHEAIPSVGWPAMTMRFTFLNVDDNIKALKPESHVKFSFFQQGNISLLNDINVIPS
ncbi:copper-binding protein [Plesiomonas shigelloides]|uniref:copper-binding protein n=1 Tax=Plesiomonas shigelloides TaxID=703 RepID=UPI00057AD31A|nr:copper-binding protein [Plesiomonas shigelloides]